MNVKARKSNALKKTGARDEGKKGKKFPDVTNFQDLIALIKGGYEKYLYYCRAID